MTLFDAVIVGVLICTLMLVLGGVEQLLWERRQDRREKAQDSGAFTDWVEDDPADFDWRRSA